MEETPLPEAPLESDPVIPEKKDDDLDRIREELDFDPVIIATGGHSTELATASSTISRVEPDLTLLGLALIWEKNRD